MTHRPLDIASLNTLALRYVGRYATSRARLSRYLERKIFERGWAGAEPPGIPAIVERFAALGYVDDRALAEAKGRALVQRGYGVRRVGLALDALGIAREDAETAREAAAEAGWEAALCFAKRRRLGPFAPSRAGPDEHRRAFAAMARAGHDPATIRRILGFAPGNVPEWD